MYGAGVVPENLSQKYLKAQTRYYTETHQSIASFISAAKQTWFIYEIFHIQTNKQKYKRY